MAYSSAYGDSYNSTGYDYSSDAGRNDNTSTNDNLNYEKNSLRKIIMDASVTMNVTDIDSTVDEVVNVALDFEGYVVSSSNLRTTIRINSDHFKTALDRIKKLGDVTSQNITGRDVTEEFYDMELRLDNAIKARDRYLELLNAAKDMNEILRLERELERLNTTIDTIKGKLEKLKHLDQYATISVNHHSVIKEKTKKPGILSYVGIGIYKGVRWLFVRN